MPYMEEESECVYIRRSICGFDKASNAKVFQKPMSICLGTDMVVVKYQAPVSLDDVLFFVLSGSSTALYFSLVLCISRHCSLRPVCD